MDRPMLFIKPFFRRILWIIPVAVITGSVVALFLWLLEEVTTFRWQHMQIIFLLPLAGILIVWLYKRYGKNAALGNNLIIDEIHAPGGGVPARMTPMILFTTLITHLFGGSAGREGTAVQMGGSIAAALSKWYHAQDDDRKILLMSGIAAGFGAVFGTPFAGAIFAVEVLIVGKVHYKGLLPCFAAAFIADLTCAAYGIHHTHYIVTPLSHLTWQDWLPQPLLFCKAIAAGILFGLAGYLFAKSSHLLQRVTVRYIQPAWLIPVLGGITVIGISYALDSFDYLGLGVTNPDNGVSIVNAFHAGGASSFSWCWKLLLTVITLSTGFKGGEVTPLFFIGATLGNTLAQLSGSPVDLFAALGFIAVFAGATNTPIACTIMGIELFGGEYTVYYAAACFAAYYFSGHKGIYRSQKVLKHKWKR